MLNDSGTASLRRAFEPSITTRMPSSTRRPHSTRSVSEERQTAILAMLGIVIGVAAVSAIMSIGDSFKGTIVGEFNKFGAASLFVMPGDVEAGPQTAMAASTLTFEDEAAVAAAVQAERSGGLIQTATYVEVGPTRKMVTVIGTNEHFQELQSWYIAEGRMFTRAEHDGKQPVAVVGVTFRDTFFGKDDDVIGKTFAFQGKEVQIIGLLQKITMNVGVDTSRLPTEKRQRRAPPSDQDPPGMPTSRGVILYFSTWCQGRCSAPDINHNTCRMREPGGCDGGLLDNCVSKARTDAESVERLYCIHYCLRRIYCVRQEYICAYTNFRAPIVTGASGQGSEVAQWQAVTAVAEAEQQGELVLLHLKTGIFYGLDPIGTRVWRLLREPRSLEQITTSLCLEFNAPPEVVSEDVAELLEQLEKALLVRRA